ncbi:MAG: type IV toxin-antitoxin system AbiEi family antitoxin [Candidatus Eremiobacterota bacterium]
MVHATPRLAQVCEEEGWSWFDGAGNCRLDVPGLLYMERTGRPPAPELRERRVPNLRSPEAARVIRALLSVNNAGRRWVQREVVQHFEAEPIPIPLPSLALVNKLVRDLAAQDLVTTSARGFEVSKPDALLKVWADQYPYERQVRRRYFTLLREDQLHQRMARVARQSVFPVAFGVFSAANQQAPHVRQPRTWLYVHPDHEPELTSQLEARPVDSGDNLVLLIPDDLGVFYQLDRTAPVPCTNLVQTYVDLCHAGGRGRDGAEALRTQRILPGWKSERR